MARKLQITFADPPAGSQEAQPVDASDTDTQDPEMAAAPQAAALDTFVMTGPTAPTYVVPVTDANLASEVGGYRGPLVLVLSAPGCGPCTTMIPILDALAKRYGGQVKFCRIDDSGESDFVRRVGITATPSYLYFRDGEVVAISAGAVPADSMMANIAKHLGVPRPA